MFLTTFLACFFAFVFFAAIVWTVLIPLALKSLSQNPVIKKAILGGLKAGSDAASEAIGSAIPPSVDYPPPSPNPPPPSPDGTGEGIGRSDRDVS